MKAPRSLRRLFFKNTTIAVATIMLVSIFVVDFGYVREMEKSAQEKLKLHIYTLLSVAQLDGDSIWVPAILYNQRFNKKESGLWAAVFNQQSEMVWHSLSIDEVPTPPSLSKDAGSWNFGKHDIDDHTYLTASYKVVWQDKQRYEFSFVVAEDRALLAKDIKRFRGYLVAGFVVITLSLLMGQAFMLRLAFRPIGKLEGEIAAMDEGVKDRLSGDYPKELRGVTRNLNALVEKEYQQRERYRSSMADLAHSLKTPMTILNGEIQHYPDNKTMRDALARIDSNIEYQLRRAVVTGHTVLDKGTQVTQVLSLVVEAMEKIYVERNVALHINANETHTFFGDENDLMEIFGNLLDNAFKYAEKQIQVAVTQNDDKLVIKVEDDGPGFSDQDVERIFSRGERLDQQGLGQGIGLAVVYDIVKNYRGTIDAKKSALGGALFEITFPGKEI